MWKVISRITLVVVGIVGLLVLTLAVIGIRMSLEAERTLHAHLLVMDVVGVYVTQHHGHWPRHWNDLYSTLPSRSHGIWNWPTDAAALRKRIIVDFSVSCEDVAEQTPATFSAVRQTSPNYADNPNSVERLIQVCRQACGSKSAPRGRPAKPG